MAETIIIRCTCGKKLSVKSEHVGRRVRCPACQAVFEAVPVPAPDGVASVTETAPRPSRKCPYCAESIEPDSETCPYCESNLEAAPPAAATAAMDTERPGPTSSEHPSPVASVGAPQVLPPSLVLGRVPAVTLLLFLLVLAVQVLMAIRGVEGSVDMAASGGLLASAVASGQPWRLVAYAFLHDGWLHFGLNGFALLSLGTVAEQLIGSGTYLGVYLLAAIGGGALSLLVGGEYVTVGASGSLFGILGVLVVLGIRTRKSLPRHVWVRLFGGVLPMAIYSISFGLLAQGVDHLVHLGGFVVGVASGLCMRRKPYGDQGFRYRPDMLFVLPVLLALLASLVVYGVNRQRILATAVDVPPVVQPEPPPKPAVDSLAKDLYKLVQGAGYGKVDCFEYARVHIMSVEECSAINRAVDSGRTDPVGRQAMQDFLKNRGINRVYGWVVAQLDTDLYEMAWISYDYAWGFSVPSGRHFLLKTSNTSFTTTGRFSMWVHDVGTQTITTKRGSQQDWRVFIESVVGEAYKAIRKAPAGYATTDAATQFLRLVAQEAFLERLERIGMSAAAFKAAL